jgi:geranylgeranyl diphosphate synthase type II
MDIKEIIAKNADKVEEALKGYLSLEDKQYGILYDAMRYSVLDGGKRIRPLLTLEFCRMYGGSDEAALPFACAIEMIHAYSLVHDDMPCMDNDDYRRGRLTNHKVFGEAMAVLAGDALLTDAFAVASTAKLPKPEDMADAIGILSECAGSLGMVGGQVLDILSEERELTEQEVLDIQKRKTGCLISAACCLGALAGGADEQQFDAAGRFAACLGLAFQIRDDMLDVIGNKEEMGKGVGTDAAKNTFVRLYGLEKCEQLVQQYTQYALDALNIFEDRAFLVALAKSLTDRRV